MIMVDVDYIGGGEPEAPPKKSAEEFAAEKKAATQSAFAESVKDNKSEDIVKAIENGADMYAEIIKRVRRYTHFDDYPSYRNEQYENALVFAIEHNHVTTAETLLKNGFDLGEIDADRYFSKIVNTTSDKARWCRLLVDAGYDMASAHVEETIQQTRKSLIESPSNQEFYNYLIQEHRKQKGAWEKVDDTTIAHISYRKDGFVEITDEFNFESAERIRYTRDFEIKSVATESRYFLEMPKQAQETIKEAWTALKAQGGGKTTSQWQPGHTRHLKRR